jgi:hypothetical protein
MFYGGKIDQSRSQILSAKARIQNTNIFWKQTASFYYEEKKHQKHDILAIKGQ